LTPGGAEGVVARRLQQHTISELLIPMSGALDLAEGRNPGHAQRVAYIAVSLAETLGLDAPSRLAAMHAGLVHDVGVIASGAGLAAVARSDERMIFAALPLLTPEEAALGVSETPELVVERLVEHPIHGARAAQELELQPEVVKAVASHHENWDGSGYPHGMRGNEIPKLGRVLALADQVEGLIAQTSPLLARRNFPFWLQRLAGKEADPEMVTALRELGSGDTFWLGMFGVSLQAELSGHSGRLRESRSMRLMSFVETFAQLVDSRFNFTVGVSGRVARFSEQLGKSVGLSDARTKQLRLAALLHDIGQLSVSERIMAKPGILSVEELDILRLHPVHSHDIVSGISGLEEVAEWVAAHHERPDGRGYPEGRFSNEIPVESRILAICDAYVALTSDRPHRRALETPEAMRQLRAAAGSQLDRDLVEVFLGRVAG
jgi:HD-GYP domain-containing protein (c-di-GMP phosphodiesterase class II)